MLLQQEWCDHTFATVPCNKFLSCPYPQIFFCVPSDWFPTVVCLCSTLTRPSRQTAAWILFLWTKNPINRHKILFATPFPWHFFLQLFLHWDCSSIRVWQRLLGYRILDAESEMERSVRVRDGMEQRLEHRRQHRLRVLEGMPYARENGTMGVKVAKETWWLTRTHAIKKKQPYLIAQQSINEATRDPDDSVLLITDTV